MRRAPLPYTAWRSEPALEGRAASSRYLVPKARAKVTSEIKLMRKRSGEVRNRKELQKDTSDSKQQACQLCGCIAGWTAELGSTLAVQRIAPLRP